MVRINEQKCQNIYRSWVELDTMTLEGQNTPTEGTIISILLMHYAYYGVRQGVVDKTKITFDSVITDRVQNN